MDARAFGGRKRTGTPPMSSPLALLRRWRRPSLASASTGRDAPNPAPPSPRPGATGAGAGPGVGGGGAPRPPRPPKLIAGAGTSETSGVMVLLHARDGSFISGSSEE